METNKNLFYTFSFGKQHEILKQKYFIVQNPIFLNRESLEFIPKKQNFIEIKKKITDFLFKQKSFDTRLKLTIGVTKFGRVSLVHLCPAFHSDGASGLKYIYRLRGLLVIFYWIFNQKFYLIQLLQTN
jgi:hypothetical protein